VKVGREDEARFILERLRGNEGEEKVLAEAEFQDIRSVSQLERKAGNRTSYWAMFTGRGSGDLHTGRRVQLVIWLQIMQEWVGIAGVTICKSQLLTEGSYGTDKNRCSNNLPHCWVQYGEVAMDLRIEQHILHGMCYFSTNMYLNC